MYHNKRLILGISKMKMKESYDRLVLRHFLKYPTEMLNAMNDDCEEEYEKIVSNVTWSENFYV